MCHFVKRAEVSENTHTFVIKSNFQSCDSTICLQTHSNNAQSTHNLIHTAIFFADFNISEIALLPNNAGTQISYSSLLQQTVINFFQNSAVMLLS